MENLETLLSERFDYIIDCIDGFRTKARLIAWCRRNRMTHLSPSAAPVDRPTRPVSGWPISAAREHDALFSKTRKLLRHEYGFPDNLKRRFDIPCVYSDEQPLFPTEDGGSQPAETECASRGRP